jgi:hypothetical protein
LASINPRQIKDDHARHSLELALEYKRQIDELVIQLPDAARERLADMLTDIQQWLEVTVTLSQSIDAAEGNPTVLRDRVELPRKIEQLKAQEMRERNTQKKLKLKETIANYEQLIEHLKGLEIKIREMHTRLDANVEHFKEVFQSIEALQRSIIERLSSHNSDE